MPILSLSMRDVGNNLSLARLSSDSGAYIDTILMELYTHFNRPVTIFIREVLESESTFKGAVLKLSSTSLIAPSYIIVGGMKSGEGAVISRYSSRVHRYYTNEQSILCMTLRPVFAPPKSNFFSANSSSAKL